VRCLRCKDSGRNPRPTDDASQEDWDLYKKRARFIQAGKCPECGVSYDRRVQSNRRRGPMKSKRGRNSGKVSQHGKQSGG
jgi:hypothetical protein